MTAGDTFCSHPPSFCVSLCPIGSFTVAPFTLFIYNAFMPLTLPEVQHIAELAKLELTEDELARFREQLSAVLDYAADLQKVDSSSISPTATVLPLRTVLREDVAKPSLDRAALLANAAEQEAGCFKVPAVLE